MRYSINHSDGTAFVEVGSLTYNGEWMGDEYVTVTIKSEEPIDFMIGDYIEYRGERYTLNVIPTVAKQARKGSYREAFVYDSVKFYSESDKLTRCKFLDYVLYQNSGYYTGLAEFNFHAMSVIDFADRLKANLDRIYTGAEAWTVNVILDNGVYTSGGSSVSNHDSAPGKKNKVVSVKNNSCWEAMKLVKDEFDLNFIVRGRVITIGGKGDLISRYFSYGLNNGLFKIERTTDDTQLVVTRLRAYGNTTNIPVRYYANLGTTCYIDFTDLEYVVAGDAPKRSVTFQVPASKANRFRFVTASEKKEGLTYTAYQFTMKLGGKVTDAFFAYNGTEYESYINLSNYDTGKQDFESSEAWMNEFDKGERIATVMSNFNKDTWPAQYKNVDKDNHFPDNMNCQRLMLPGFPRTSLSNWAIENLKQDEWDGAYSTSIVDPYIDSHNVTELGVREATVYFDGSGDLEDIYPSIEWSKGGVAKNVVVTGSNIEDDGTYDKEQNFPNFKITIDDIGFNPKEYENGSQATISFKDGKCGGREFNIAGATKVGSGYELTLQRSEDSSVQLYFPYKGMQIEPGDKFVILNIDMPDTYIEAASEELLRQAKLWLAQNDYVVYKYALSIDELFMQRQHDSHIEKGEESIHDTIKAGDLLHFTDDDLFINGTISIDKLEIKENDGNALPKYSVTLVEKKSIGTIQRIQQQIDVITSGGGSGTGGGYSLTDIEKIATNIGDRTYLSKVHDDTAQGNITFGQNIYVEGKTKAQGGLEVGQYVQGSLAEMGGSGAAIDSNGDGEMNGLRLRSFLEVPELRFNRIDVVSGELWNSIAFGLIDHVVIDSDGRGGTAYLHLDANERGGLHVDDICRGSFASFDDDHASDINDHNNFTQLQGFWTSYFTPTSIVENQKGKFAFRYALQPGTTVHPCAAMKFAVYGNFNDPTRRASAYHTRTYTRYLKNVDTWKVDPDTNIASQFGNLEGLNIGGMDMHGEGTYLENVYMSGTSIQFTKQQKEELGGHDAYSVVLSDYEAILHVDTDGNIIGIEKVSENVAMTENGTVVNVTSNENNEETNVIISALESVTSIQVYKGNQQLAHAEETREMCFTVDAEYINCEGDVENGSLIIRRVIDANSDAMVYLKVNCEGEVVFDKKFAVTVVKDASNAIIADFDNEMDTVVYNTAKDIIVNPKLYAIVKMYNGNDEMVIDRFIVDESRLPDGISAITKKDGSDYKAEITVAKNAEQISKVWFKVTGRISEEMNTQHERYVSFTVNKVATTHALKLVPDSAEVKISSDGKFDGSASTSIKCKVLVSDGDSSFTAASYSALSDYNAKMFYRIDGTGDNAENASEMDNTKYSNGISVTTANKKVVFWVYFYPDGFGNASTRIKFDMETIHILADATEKIESFMFTRSNTTPTKLASNKGSFTDPSPADSIWKDGIPDGEAQVWMIQRTFCSDASKSDASWSDPRSMTDTADFDVCYHDANDDNSTPAAPTTHHAENQGNGWYNSTSGKTPMWMATDKCKNGTWEGWKIVKILGESPVVADLDNEGDGLGVGSDGILDVAMDTSTNFYMYYGHEELYVESVTVTGMPTNSSAETTTNTTNKHAKVDFTWGENTDFTGTNSHRQIKLTGTAKYKGVTYTRDAYYSIHGNKDAEDGVMYYLVPSANAIKKSKTGTFTPSSLTCARYKKVGSDAAVASAEGTFLVSTNGSTFSNYATVSNFANVTNVIFKWTIGSFVLTETVPVIEDGTDGKDGKDGSQGIQGPKGADATQYYIHTAWCNNISNGSGFSTTNTTGKAYDYIGTRIDTAKADSTNFRDYDWTYVKGDDGEDGKPGSNGVDGKTYYTHIAWCNNISNGSGFSTSKKSGQEYKYIGTLVDETKADSTDWTKYSWVYVKGDTGAKGDKGDKGDKGATGDKGERGINGCIVRTRNWEQYNTEDLTRETTTSTTYNGFHNSSTYTKSPLSVATNYVEGSIIIEALNFVISGTTYSFSDIGITHNGMENETTELGLEVNMNSDTVVVITRCRVRFVGCSLRSNSNIRIQFYNRANKTYKTICSWYNLGNSQTPATYYNDSENTNAAVRYIDVVTVANGTGFAAFQCVETHNTSECGRPAVGNYNSTYWQPAQESAFLNTNLLMAQYAKIKFASGNQLLMLGENQKVVGGLSGFGTSSKSTRMWLGGSEPASANFRVTDDGILTANGANINGAVTAYKDGVKVSSFNGNGDGTIVYYYPNGNTMREDSFEYNSSGSVTGMITTYYDINGAPKWRLGSSGISTQLSSFWTAIKVARVAVTSASSPGSSQYSSLVSAVQGKNSVDANNIMSRFSTTESQYSSYNNRVANGNIATSTVPSSSTSWFTGWIIESQLMNAPVSGIEQQGYVASYYYSGTKYSGVYFATKGGYVYEFGSGTPKKVY